MWRSTDDLKPAACINTVDFTIRGDVTLDADGSDAGECEGDGLGEDIQINALDETVEQFEATFGGSGCSTIGTYSLNFVMTDSDDDVKTFGPFSFAVIGPTISGTAQVGETLTADISSIAATEHWASSSFTYRWIRNDGTSDSNIPGATSATYTLVDADEGKTIKVRVDFTDDLGQRTLLTSAATATVAARNNTASGAPTITGTAQLGETLTADTTGISDSDGLTNATYTYQWLADDTEISGATSSNYTLATTDEGKAIKVKVSFTDDAGNEESRTSTATSEVDPATAQQKSPNSPATGAPTITGTAQVGQTLTAGTTGISDSDGLTNATYTYQWLTDDTEVSGATSSTYTLVAADVGKAIKVRVSFTDDAGNEESLTSDATAAVAARPNDVATGAPTITGTAKVGQTLTAGTTGISDSDGLTNTTYTYQWLTDDTEVSGATSSTYTLVAADVGKAIDRSRCG